MDTTNRLTKSETVAVIRAALRLKFPSTAFRYRWRHLPESAELTVSWNFPAPMEHHVRRELDRFEGGRYLCDRIFTKSPEVVF